MQDVQVLPLVFVDALDLDVEQRIRIDADARLRCAIAAASVALFARLTAPPRFAERAVVGERLEPRQLLLGVADPRRRRSPR